MGFFNDIQKKLDDFKYRVTSNAQWAGKQVQQNLPSMARGVANAVNPNILPAIQTTKIVSQNLQPKMLKQYGSNLRQGLSNIADPNRASQEIGSFAKIPNIPQPIAQAGMYGANRYLAPLIQTPARVKQLKAGIQNRNIGDVAMGALGTLGGVAALSPDPFSDIAFPAFDATKGYLQGMREYGQKTGSKSSFDPKAIKYALKGALQAGTLEKPVGLGEALTSDPTGQTIGNIAELPLAIGMTHRLNKGVPLFDKKTISEAQKVIGNEARNSIGKFAQMVETSGNPNRKNLGAIGDEIQSIAEGIWGKKAQNLTNTQLKNAFDLLLQQMDQGKGYDRSLAFGLSTKAINREQPNPLDTLLQEAKKYKSAEEFIRKEIIGNGEIRPYKKGDFVGSESRYDSDRALFYKGKFVEFIPEGFDKKQTENFLTNIIKNKEGFKSQLTDIWNQANKGVENPITKLESQLHPDDVKTLKVDKEIEGWSDKQYKSILEDKIQELNDFAGGQMSKDASYVDLQSSINELRKTAKEIGKPEVAKMVELEANKISDPEQARKYIMNGLRGIRDQRFANKAKSAPKGFNPMEDLPGTRPGLRAEFDNAIARQDVETIQKLLPEVPEAYKKQVGKYLDPLLATPSVKRINILKQPRSEKVALEMLQKGTIDTPKYNEIAGREGFPVRQLQQQGQQAKMLEPIAKQDKQMAMAEAELRAGIGADIGLTNQDRTKLGQLKKMFERADKEQGAWDVESLKKNNKTLVNWATERWRELGGGTKDNLTDDEIINEVYDFLSNNQLSGKLRPNTPSSVKTLQQMKEDQKAVARLTGYGEDQYSVRNPKPMTLSDAEKQAKLHEQAIEQTYKTRDASVDELEALLRTPDAELKGGYKIEKGGGQPTFPIKGKGDDPKTFRGIINKYFGGKQNIKLTQYEQVKPIANVKFTDDGAKQAIRAIESGDTANLTPQAQEYVTNLRKSFDQVRSEAVADGLPIGYVDNYLTHYWQQDPATVQAVINKLRTSGAFQKERTFLTYQEGIDAGLTPRFQNPTQILGNYVRQVENVRNNLKLVKALEGNNFIVSGDARKITPGVREIAIPGFDGKFAKPEIAQFIENLFEPRQANKILSTLGNISGKIQDVTLSGGIPGTPFNAFSVSANLQKHFLAGRFTGPVKSFARAFSPESTTKYFNENIPAIREIQGAGYNLPTTLSYNKLMGDDTTGVGKVWNMAVSDPTFKRFIPMLQIDLYKEVKNRALKQGLSAEQAVEKGIQVLKNFEGMSDQFSRAASDPNAQAAIRTVFFAPKFRKAIIDIWVNSIKALKNPLALENQYNVRFLAGSILAFAGYNAANAYFNNGKMMWENGRNKEDKLIIPDGKGGQIGIPFLSSLATIPRGIARQALKVAKGDVSGAATDAGQTYLSSGIKPIADVAANQDYFGKTISPPDSQNKWGDILKYLGKSYASHPYIKELIDPANMVDPAYQRLSRAMELPFRFYDKKSVEGSKYYEARDKALEGMNEIEKKAYDAIPKYDANNPNTQIFKYQTFLTYPNVFEAKRMTEFNLAKQTGKPIDPLYLVNYDTAKAYMRYETLPPGSQDRKDLIKAMPELGTLFDVRSKYFDENPIEGQTTSNRPLPSTYVQQQMDAKNWKDPQVKAYLDANRIYQNEQRAKLGLTPLAGFTPYQKKVTFKKISFKIPKVKAFKAKKLKFKKIKYRPVKFKKFKVKKIKV